MKGPTIYQWDGMQGWANNIMMPNYTTRAFGHSLGEWIDPRLKRDQIITLKNGTRKLCRIGDYMIFNPDGSWFRNLDYLPDYNK